MACVLILLPSILTEPAVATLSGCKARKRSFWKPSAAESMNFFIDLQQVFVEHTFALTCLIS